MRAGGRITILRLCALVGMRVKHVTYHREHGWDGQRQVLHLDRSIKSSDITHELAHWLVAQQDPLRLSLSNWGLGPSFDAAGDEGEERGTEAEQDEMERQASALGIWIERRLGRDWRDTLWQHSWYTTEEWLNVLRSIPLPIRQVAEWAVQRAISGEVLP